MSKIWILEHTDDNGMKFYWCQALGYQSYVADINSATIFHLRTEIEDLQKSLVATKPKIVSVNIVPVKNETKG
jgi:hypothetical protein